jgi:hypothetical protein
MTQSEATKLLNASEKKRNETNNKKLKIQQKMSWHKSSKTPLH